MYAASVEIYLVRENNHVILSLSSSCLQIYSNTDKLLNLAQPDNFQQGYATAAVVFVLLAMIQLCHKVEAWVEQSRLINQSHVLVQSEICLVGTGLQCE